ncbi:lytic transglycosylase domain-containing protein [Chitinophaga sedimenti]|uniref:lytic transglycosylase domain-containing protein n=1 Tax=Chitinophaga sedimenti TaxID=2033606 RepID=UPI0020063E7E|nr:lytic transglycosylase domain-containing protein [Chitinophaga sedimenti]MCK7559299.1 lytic transglycosylase domain-containing protein [Chitinophaga sedimenti]
MTKVFLLMLLPIVGAVASVSAKDGVNEIAPQQVVAAADTAVLLKKGHLPKDTVRPSYATTPLKQAAASLPSTIRSPKVYEQVNNHYVTGYINDFATRYSNHLQVMITKSEPYFVMIEKVFKEHGVPEEMKYLALIESGFNTNARSRVGAVGAWQFMSATARVFGLNVGKKVDERKDFYKSTVAAAKYLNELNGQFDDWLLVVAAYNCGAGGVMRAQKMSGRDDFWGIQYFLPAESGNHVYKFIATGYILDRFNTFFGVGDDKPTPVAIAAPALPAKPLTDEELYNTVVFTITGKYKLEAIAKKLQIENEDLQRLNPNFYESLAGADNSYELRIPKDKMKEFQAEKEEILKESLQIALDDKASSVDRSKFPAPVAKPSTTAAAPKTTVAKKPVAAAKKKPVAKKKPATKKPTTKTATVSNPKLK